jgi:hypothetical protein
MEPSQVCEGELPKPSRVDSVGYVVEENKDYVTLAREIMGRDWRGLICIPQCCVLCHTHEMLSEVKDD